MSDEEMVQVPGTFGFSAIPMDMLEESEYSLVTILVDVSSSVSRFRDLLINMLKASIKSCEDNPRAENLLIRVCTFADQGYFNEIHGFKPLEFIDFSVYDKIRCGGMTAACDAMMEALNATDAYAKTLWEQDFKSNAHIIMITDGQENDSKYNTNDVDSCLRDMTMQERRDLESVFSLLIAVNMEDPRIAQILDDFHKECGFDQFLDAKDATPETMSKIQGWITSSISSSVRALGSGSKSAILQV